MSLTKVMIVDDEILAINYLNSIMPWEKHGYQMVAQATTVHKAFDLFRECQPQIVILDIRMPVMDGLEFSKKLLESNHQVKIILLTSYRDFDYVKQALELGVSGYLLKHEINETTLAAHLDRTRKLLDEDIRITVAIRKQIMRKLLENNRLNDADLEMIKADINSKNGMLLLLIMVDTGYPLFGGDTKAVHINYELDWNLCDLPDGISCYDISNVAPDKWIALMTFDQFYGDKNRIELITRAVLSLQSNCRACGGNTVSVLASRQFFHIEDLYQVYSELDKRERFVVFYGRGKIIRWNEMEHDSDETDQVLSDSLDLKKDFDCLKQEVLGCHDLQIDELLLKLFQHSIFPKPNPNILDKLCHDLLLFLEEFYNQNEMSCFTDFLNTNNANIKLYSVEDIRLWFRDRFTQAIRTVKNQDLGRFSKKVKQAIQHIKSNYAANISLEDLGKLTGISGERLRHLFRDETGMTIADYITQCRIEMAKELLQKGSYKVYEVAEIVGFNSSQYFSQVFKKITGVNPLDFTESK